ncbi:MAG TPA: hypothetical protein VEY33_06370, partial [Gemmatimonadota bacterium]|nr:hypothetical protein [Gemmatimonadota bacterium]
PRLPGQVAVRAGVPRVGDVDKLLTKSKLLEPVAIDLTQIATIQPMGRASWTKPPWARLTFADDRHLDLGILAGPRRMSKDPANDAAFDDWLARVQSQLVSVSGSGQ